MKTKIAIMVYFIICLPAVGICQECSCQHCVTFDPLLLKTQYGTPAGHQPGDFIFEECGIHVLVDSFLFNPSSGAFNFSQVDTPFVSFGKNNILGTNNITLTFDFNQLGFNVFYISFEFCDLGGFENIAVNGEPVIIGELADATTKMPVGIFLDIVTSPVPGGIRGTATLFGLIESLRLGGQEFWMDNVCVSDLAPKCVTFDNVFTLGEKFGAPDDTALTQIKVQNNVTVFVDSFRFTGPGGAFNYCKVDTAFPWFGMTPIMQINNINLILDFSSAGFIVDCAEFEFYDAGGFENIAVNREPIFAGELESAPGNIAPGVTLNVSMLPAPGGKKGLAKLIGPMTELILGGQEFWIDNICAYRITQINDIDNREWPVFQFPENIVLEQNYPNPFNPKTEIRFRLTNPAMVDLKIYNISGKEIRTLTQQTFSRGTHSLEWDGKDQTGMDVPTGLYLYKLRTGSTIRAKKMNLIR